MDIFNVVCYYNKQLVGASVCAVVAALITVTAALICLFSFTVITDVISTVCLSEIFIVAAVIAYTEYVRQSVAAIFSSLMYGCGVR